jgi:tripartite-type tricarboxylate transporter receptor subunit TctC
LAAGLALAACTTTDAGPPSNDGRAFFRGKTLTYIVATEPGGGYDTYGRLVSRYLAKHLGLGRVVVLNVPGGSHFRGTNQIYASRPDGLTLGIFNTGLIYAQLLHLEGFDADLTRMSWIGKAADDPRVLTVSAKSRFRSLDDLRRAERPLLLGADGVSNSGYIDALLVSHVLGVRLKPVFGLSTREAQLSMMRGEIDGDFGAASSHRPFVRNGFGHTIFRLGLGGGVDQSIPDITDLARTETDKAMLALVRSQATLLRWTAGPPGIPEDRLGALREAYMAALRDPEFVAEARKLDIPIAPMDGATLANEIERVLSQPAETVELVSSIVRAGR